MTIEQKRQAIGAGADKAGRKVWIEPDIVFSDIGPGTNKLSSTVEFYVPEFHRTLGPS